MYGDPTTPSAAHSAVIWKWGPNFDSPTGQELGAPHPPSAHDMARIDDAAWSASGKSVILAGSAREEESEASGSGRAVVTSGMVQVCRAEDGFVARSLRSDVAGPLAPHPTVAALLVTGTSKAGVVQVWDLQGGLSKKLVSTPARSSSSTPHSKARGNFNASGSSFAMLDVAGGVTLYKREGAGSSQVGRSVSRRMRGLCGFLTSASRHRRANESATLVPPRTNHP